MKKTTKTRTNATTSTTTGAVDPTGKVAGTNAVTVWEATTRKTSSKSSSSSTALMDAFLNRIDDDDREETSLVALASRIEKECFPRLKDKYIPTTLEEEDDGGDGVVRSKQPLGNDDEFVLCFTFFFNWSRW